MIPPIIDVAGVLVSSDIITERFCCDLEQCKGACCVEGDAGAPVTLDEIGEIEDALDVVWEDMDCVFTYYDDLEISDARISHCCLCALEKAYRTGLSKFCKPISCALYPIREKRFSSGLIGLNYHRWSVCECARKKGKSLDLPIYRFLKEPLIRRFGKEWYAELETIVKELAAQGFEV